MSTEPECWCEWVDIGVGMQRVTDEPTCPQHYPLPDGPPELSWGEVKAAFAGLNLVIEATAADMFRMLELLRDEYGWTHICTCPTPTHRMSCGVDATPKVVTT